MCSCSKQSQISIGNDIPALQSDQQTTVSDTVYKTYVRPHLEYCIQAWSPSLRKDIDCLENVQRRATKMVFGLKKLSYEQRLRRLNLTTLEERRKRGDLIEMYKLLTQKENVDYMQFFQKEDNHHRLREQKPDAVIRWTCL